MAPFTPLAFGAAFLSLLLWTEAALAQRVLLVEPDSTDRTLSEAFNRLRAELLLQEFEVTTLPADPSLSPETLEEAARTTGAFAAVLLTRSAGGTTADVCIADRVTGKTSQRRLAITNPRQAPRVLAVRAVDLLRSSLREYSEGERPPVDVVGVQPEPVPESVRTFSTEERAFRLRAAGVFLGGVSDVGPAWGGSIGLSYAPAPWIGVGIVVAGPLMGARFRAPTGVASVRQELALATVTVDLLSADSFDLGPTLGAGVYHLHAQGEVDAPLRATSDGVWAAAGSIGFDAGVHLTSALVLSGSLVALFVSPRPVVAVASAEAPLGVPVLMASAGVGVEF